MGEKDITQKALMNNNDVFADVVNVLMFDGKNIVDAGSLRSAVTTDTYRSHDKIRETERDVAKIFHNRGTDIMFLGIENQTAKDPDESVRVIAYDGAAYRSSLLKDKKNRYGVATLVLYYGEERWKHNRELHERINVPEEWKPYINGYKINLYEIAYLPEEKRSKFKSDFWIVADFLYQQRTQREYYAPDRKIDHPDELLKLMSVLTDDDRFAQQINDIEKGKEGGVTMCEVLDKIEARGEQRGIEIGEQRGEIRGRVDTLYSYMKKTPGEICKILSITEDEVKKIIEEMSEK